MMTIKIKHLRLRAVIGVGPWEREHLQDIIVNVAMDYDGAKAAMSDDIADTIDYKAVKQRIMDAVEHSSFHLVEKLVQCILEMIMEDANVQAATVEVDKPHALRFADSVSISARMVRGR